MRLCDRDIEAWLDEGRLSINPRPPVERINGATVDVRLGNKFRTFRGHTAAYIDLSGPKDEVSAALDRVMSCLIYTSPSPRDRQKSRMP